MDESSEDIVVHPPESETERLQSDGHHDRLSFIRKALDNMHKHSGGETTPADGGPTQEQIAAVAQMMQGGAHEDVAHAENPGREEEPKDWADSLAKRQMTMEGVLAKQRRDEEDGVERSRNRRANSSRFMNIAGKVVNFAKKLRNVVIKFVALTGH